MSFVLLDTDGRAKGSVGLGTEELIFGRELIAQLGGGTDASISRRHARAVVREGAVHLEDLGSKNGTLLNGIAIDGSARLRTGDLIEIGDHRFRLVHGDAREVPAVEALHGATIAASRSSAPERLRLVYELSRLLADALPAKQIALRLHLILERALAPRLTAVWIGGRTQSGRR